MTVTVTQTSVRVAADEAGERLDRVLARHFAGQVAGQVAGQSTGNVAALSRSRIKALIEAGAVVLDGKTIRDPNHRVNSGAAIVIDVPPPEPAKPAAEPIPLNVVYEDDDIIVIDKPRNLVVHPAAGNWTGTLVNALIAHCGDSLSGIGGERRPGIVHRLDKDTTGLLVVAKNDRAHRALAAQFADHGRSDAAFERGYLAFVWGAPERPHGTIDRPIDRDSRARDRMAVREGGREAVTHWQVLERYRGDKTAKKTTKAGKAEPAGGEPTCLPARNRPDPPDSGPFGLDRASFDGGRDLRGRISHQIRSFAGKSSNCAGGPWQTGAPFPYPVGQTPQQRRNIAVPVGTAA